MCADIDCQIEVGLCHCGCGQSAPLAKKTAKKYGHVKGEPVRYISWHYQQTNRLSPVDHVVDEATGCWVWQRGRVGGYGEMRDGGIMRRAHRVYYERFRGPIPRGLYLDHLCRNPACVNPDHLEPVTPRENALRGNTIAARRAAQTHCVRGHPFDEANTIRRGNGRACRECQREAVRESQRKRYARLAASGQVYPRKLIAGFPPVDYWVDPVPAGLMMGHLCRNHACVNPYHLEPVTATENAARRDRAKRKRALRVLR
jgi:hypothetical protein